MIVNIERQGKLPELSVKSVTVCERLKRAISGLFSALLCVSAATAVAVGSDNSATFAGRLVDYSSSGVWKNNEERLNTITNLSPVKFSSKK